MFQDEAGFGRINRPKYCWCVKGIRPTAPSHHIREYRYAYGAVDPIDGESFFLVLPYTNTDCMNIFLKELSNAFPDDYIIWPCDQATWHRSKSLIVPNNIQIFQTLEKVVDRLCETICFLTKEIVKSVTGRQRIIDVFS